METIDKIITKVSSKYGAPIGRISRCADKPTDKKIFDCAVPLNNGGYDKGGAYWGFPNNLRVSYTKDLSYFEFYRKG